MDRFESDVMEDLMYDAAEGPARTAAFDEYDEGDTYDEYDEGDEGDDEFLGRVLGGAAGQSGGGQQFDEWEEGDEYEAADEYDDFDAAGEDYDAYDEGDPMEEMVADAMDAGDGDEFFRRLAGIARRVGRGIGQVARTVAPIASMIPLPQAQLVGRLANVAGRLLADGADEYEAFDELVDGLDEDGIDAAAPVLAGMVLRRAVPAVARAAAPVRRAAVHGVTQAVRQAVRRQGPPAARAVARAVRATRRVVQQRRMPPRAAARVVRTAAQQVARRPQVARRLARPLVPAARRATPRGQAARVVARTVAPIARQAAASGPAARRGGIGGGCPHCAGRRLRLRGPVTITIRAR
ncbi:MAG TPA: hypothetical protein VNO84_16605 [Burkholderiaceae bacterium]|nr:hypothetical protein [Burkholderiaceae bacterium]